jgi:hypothetical protein
MQAESFAGGVAPVADQSFAALRASRTAPLQFVVPLAFL